MIRTNRVRVIPASDVGAAPFASPQRSESADRGLVRVTREELEGRDHALRIVAEARRRADEIVRQAEHAAREAVARARRDTIEEHEAVLAARWLALTRSQASALERDADRVVSVGVAVAERLFGCILTMDPSRIVDVARTVLDEARGARTAVFFAHPADAKALSTKLAEAGFGPCSVEVREDPALGRGDLRLQTDIVNIDAKHAPRLERLAAALRSASSRI